MIEKGDKFAEQKQKDFDSHITHILRRTRANALENRNTYKGRSYNLAEEVSTFMNMREKRVMKEVARKRA